MSHRAPSRLRQAPPLSAALVIGIAAPALVFVSGCAKDVKADFPRPPVTATLPLPQERDAAEPEDEAPHDDGPVEAEVVGPDETESEASASPPPATATPPREPPAEPEPAPPPPTPPPPSTQLGGRSTSDDPEVTSKLRRAGTLLSSVNLRELSAGQRQQLSAARTFVAQARLALDDGDERRALVLVDKGLILVEDVERSSRR